VVKPAPGDRRSVTDPVIVILTLADLALFAGGSAAHAGIAIPLAVSTWTEPVVVPAAIIEGIGAIALLVTAVAIAANASWSRRLAWWVAWYCFAAVLWGMARLAIGSIPEARTMTNDFLHIGMTIVTTGLLVRLASLGSAERAVNDLPDADQSSISRGHAQ
jgi:hypothetical protein